MNELGTTTRTVVEELLLVQADPIDELRTVIYQLDVISVRIRRWSAASVPA